MTPRKSLAIFPALVLAAGLASGPGSALSGARAAPDDPAPARTLQRKVKPEVSPDWRKQLRIRRNRTGLDPMCPSPGFKETSLFANYFAPNPSPIHYQCARELNLVCTRGYSAGQVQAQGSRMSYPCTKSVGGPAPSAKECIPGFTVKSVTKQGYLCENAAVKRACYQKHWLATGLKAAGNSVFYQCRGKSM